MAECGLTMRWRPDALGVLPNRTFIEVEVKTSMEDFRRNIRKRIWNYRVFGCFLPAFFYFAVPPEMAEQAGAELRNGAGLLVDGVFDEHGTPTLNVVVPAKRNHDATRLSILDVARLVVKQSNTLCRYAVRAAKIAA